MSEQPPDPGAPGSSPSDRPPQTTPPSEPFNPYAQPTGPEPSRPVWQGHQAPQQAGTGATDQPAARDGRRTWLIVLAMLLFVAVVGGAVTAAVLIAEDDSESAIAVADIEAGDCLDSEELANSGDRVETIEKVGCSGEHDAEVFATIALDAGEEDTAAGAKCVDELDDVGQTWSALDVAGIEVRPLVADDKVVCFIRHQDGEPLTGSEFE